MAKLELQDKDIGELWRRYRPVEGRDNHADLIVALIRKLVVQQDRDVPYGNWSEKLLHPLRSYGMSKAEWDEDVGQQHKHDTKC